MYISKVIGTAVIDMNGILTGSVFGWRMNAEKSESGAIKLHFLLVKATENVGGYVCRLPFDEIIGMSEDAIIIRCAKSVTALAEADAQTETSGGLGARVYTPMGSLLGTVTDMQVDDRGRIGGLALDNGEMVSARRIIAYGNVFMVSKPQSAFPFDMGTKTKTATGAERSVITIEPAE